MDPRVDTLPANRAQNPQGKAANLCPFGCEHGRKADNGEDEINEHGYCRHLIGWTDPRDQSSVQLRQVWADGRERTGLKSEPVRATDIVIPMKTPSCRVYRAGEGERPHVRYRDPTEARVAADNDALMALVREQAERVASLERQLQELGLAQTAEVK